MENVRDDMTNGKAVIPVLDTNTTPKSSSIEQDAVSEECVSVTKSYPKSQATLGRFGIPTNDPFSTPNKDCNTFNPPMFKVKKNIAHTQNWESVREHSSDCFPYTNSVSVTPRDVIGNSNASPIDLSITIDDSRKKTSKCDKPKRPPGMTNVQ